MSNSIVRPVGAIFSKRHYGYFSDLIRGIENTATLKNSGIVRVNYEPPVKNDWGYNIPQQTANLNMDVYNRISSPYFESDDYLIDLLGQDKIEKIEARDVYVPI